MRQSDNQTLTKGCSGRSSPSMNRGSIAAYAGENALAKPFTKNSAKSWVCRSWKQNHLGLLSRLVISSFAFMIVGCGGFLKSNRVSSETNSHNLSSATKPILVTTFSETSSSVLVKLVAEDSSRLMERLRVSEKLVAINNTKMTSKSFATKDGSLSLVCQFPQTAKSPAHCVLKISKSEGQIVTSILRDPIKMDQTITLGSSSEAKKLYDSLQLKEWDLGDSKLIRFASFDDRFILECTSSPKASRCQIFLSDGGSQE